MVRIKSTFSASGSVIFFLLVLGIGLRYWGLIQNSYSLDEMVSLHFASHPDWKALLWDNHPPLHHLILKYWMIAFGSSELATRSLSVFFSIASGVVFWILCRKSLDLRSSFFVASIYWLNPVHIMMAREARMFSMTEFLVLLSLVFYCESTPRTIGWLMTGVLMACSHYFGTLVFLGQVILYVGRLNWPKKLRFFCGFLIFGLALFAAFVLVDWDFLRWQQQSFAAGFSYSRSLSVIFSSGLILAVVLSISSLRKMFVSTQVKLIVIGIFMFCVVGLVSTLVFKKNILFERYFFLIPLFSSLLLLQFANAINMHWLALIFVVQASLFNWVYQDANAPWKQVAFFLQQQKASVVYTSLTLALQTPYFSNSGIQVRSVNDMQDDVDLGSEIWFIESYHTGLVNFSAMKDKFGQMGLTTQVYEFKNQSDAALLLRVTK